MFCHSAETLKMKIDIHTHILPNDLPDLKEKFGYGGWISVELENGETVMKKDGRFFRSIKPNCWDHNVRLKECENSKVDVQVLSTVPIMFSYWAKSKDTLALSRILNDDIARVVQKKPKKFIGMGTLPMQDTDLAILELERCIHDLGFAGIQIGSNINGKNLNEDCFFPLFEAASELGCAIFIHPWEMMGENQIKKYWLPWLVGMPAETSRAICSLIFGGIFERLPNLRVAFAHGGGSFIGTLGRIEHGFNVRPDLCALDNNINPSKYLGKFWVDSLVHDEDAFRLLLKKMGNKKIALGTDYPFPLGEIEPGKLIDDMNYSQELKDRFFYKNALEWLGLSEAKFK